MIRIRKKTKILGIKKEVANIIMSNCPKIYFKEYDRYYWVGDFNFENKIIHIFWQNYVRRLGVDYINIGYIDNGYKTIYKKELIRIKEVLKSK